MLQEIYRFFILFLPFLSGSVMLESLDGIVHLVGLAF